MVAVLVFILLLFSASAQAVTRYVAPAAQGGDDANSCSASTSASFPKRNFNGVNGAVACMSSGDTLVLRGGTYTKGIDRDSAPNIPSGGGEGSRAIITVFPGETALIQPTGAFGGIEFLNGSTNSYITFDGGTNCGANSGGAACHLVVDMVSTTDENIFGISFGGAQHVTVTNLEVKNTPNNGIGGPGTFGVISNSYLHHNGSGGQPGSGGYHIYAGGSDDWVIENNRFYYSGGYGIHLNACSETLGGVGTCGGVDHTIHRAIIRYNDISGAGQSSIQEDAGLLLGGFAEDVEAYGNISHDNVGNAHGIQFNFFRPVSRGKVYNNTVYGNARAGIAMDSASQIDVTNNLVGNNNISNGGFLNIQTASQGSGNTYTTNGCFGTGGTGGGCNSSVTPNFVNAAGGDFRFQAGSPGIDVGTNLSSPYATDIAGISRPQNGTFDLGAYEYQVTAPPVTEMLVASYGFEENTGTTFADTSGQGNNGSFGAGVTWQSTGKYGHALHFDGTGGATIADSSSLDVSTGFTLEVWAKPTSLTGDTVLVVKNPNSTYHLFASLTGFCGTEMPLGGFSGNVACRAVKLTTGIWQHVAVSYSAATGAVLLYIDGMLAATGTTSGNVPATAGTLQIGTSGFSENFIGDIDEVRIYNYARTVTQIISDMATQIVPDPLLVAGYGFGGATATVVDISPFNNNGTFGSGAARTSSKTGFGQALNFTAGTMLVPGSESLSAMTNGITLEAWVNRNNSTASWQTLIGGPTYWIFASSTGACSEGAVTAGAVVSSVVRTVCSGPITSGVWVHLALTYDTATGAMKLYKDGVVVDSATYSGTIDTSGSALRIGNDSVNEFCQCKIDDARVYNYALSQAAILTDMVTAISEGLPATPTGFRLQ